MKQGGGDDEQLCAAWGQVGAYYTERGKWGKAAQYFKQAKDLGMMAECYYRCVPDLDLELAVVARAYKARPPSAILQRPTAVATKRSL